MRLVPMRQKVHLPHDSACVKRRKKRAMSTMQSRVVEHHQAAGAHDGAGAGERVVVDGRVGQARRDAAAGRPADLHRLEAAGRP